MDPTTRTLLGRLRVMGYVAREVRLLRTTASLAFLVPMQYSPWIDRPRMEAKLVAGDRLSPKVLGAFAFS